MNVHWGSLFAVFATSLGATLAVVALVAAALVGLSARSPHLALCEGTLGDSRPARGALSRRAGTALAAACLTCAGGIVLVGLWAVVAR